MKAPHAAAASRKHDSEGLDINDNRNSIQFNPNSGVTFRENRNSDVRVVGRGYSDDSADVSDTSSQQASSRNQDKLRANKGIVHSLVDGTGCFILYKKCFIVLVSGLVFICVLGKLQLYSLNQYYSSHRDMRLRQKQQNKAKRKIGSFHIFCS